MDQAPRLSPEKFHIDACRCDSTESLPGYPKHATDEVHAHALAEEAVAELRETGQPGEYFVAVSQNGNTPVSTQVVVVPN